MTESPVLRGGTWKIDALHSQVMVAVWHFNVASLRAKFPGVSGQLEVDQEDLLRSSFGAVVETASVCTGHPKQEEFMRSEPWLDSERHPLITFRGTSVQARSGGFTALGELELKGVKKELAIPFDFRGVVSDPWGLRAGVFAQFSVDRRDFGINWDRRFDWGSMAGYDLTFALDIELAYPDESLAQAAQQAGT